MSFFSSRRSTVHGLNGGVASSQPLASQVGIDILQKGGNAVDAAISMAITLNAVEPMSTGIGGDIFSLIWDPKSEQVYSFNGSGQSSRNSDPNELLKKGYSEIPTEGSGAAYSVSVPGSVDGWENILEKFGTISLSESLQPAINLAEKGFPVSKLIAWQWQSSLEKLKFRPSGNELLLNGHAPKEGEIVTLPLLAKTMKEIAKDGSDTIYRGSIAKKIAKFVKEEGGWLDEVDLANYKSFWTEPIKTNYRGIDVFECPPNGQGIAALIALNIIENFDMGKISRNSSEFYHYLIEAMKLGFSDALWFVTDPNKTNVPTKELLSKTYSKSLYNQISNDNAMQDIEHGVFQSTGDTVYVSAIDKNGMGCSLINSLFQGFGSGMVVPGTGIALQNRGALFSLNKNHPNFLEPNVRPYHTIIPCMATKDNKLWLSFGVMGGFQQPQGHLQVISNMVDYNLDPQDALDALRFSLDVKAMETIYVEEDLDKKIISDLVNKGHKIETVSGNERIMFGGGQICQINSETGVISVGTEPRKDGSALAF